MLIFNELEVRDESLYIDVSIPRDTDEEKDYFKNVYFKELKLYSQDTFLNNVNIYADDVFNAYSYDIQKEEGSTQSFQITIPLKSIAVKDIHNSIIFVCLTTTGTPKENIPCHLDKNVWTRALLVYDDMYKKFIDSLKDIYDNSCIVPQNLSSFMLMYLAMKLALKECDYELAVELFNMLKGRGTLGRTRNCGCHG